MVQLLLVMLFAQEVAVVPLQIMVLVADTETVEMVEILPLLAVPMVLAVQ